MKILSDIKPVRGAKRVGDHCIISYIALWAFIADTVIQSDLLYTVHIACLKYYQFIQLDIS